MEKCSKCGKEIQNKGALALHEAHCKGKGEYEAEASSEVTPNISLVSPPISEEINKDRKVFLALMEYEGKSEIELFHEMLEIYAKAKNLNVSW